MTRLALCLLLLATGASASPLPYGVRVFHDDERGATCWIYQAGNGAGISCIPDRYIRSGTEAGIPASPHETQPEPTPALAPGRWIDERYEL